MKDLVNSSVPTVTCIYEMALTNSTENIPRLSETVCKDWFVVRNARPDDCPVILQYMKVCWFSLILWKLWFQKIITANRVPTPVIFAFSCVIPGVHIPTKLVRISKYCKRWQSASGHSATDCQGRTAWYLTFRGQLFKLLNGRLRLILISFEISCMFVVT